MANKFVPTLINSCSICCQLNIDNIGKSHWESFWQFFLFNFATYFILTLQLRYVSVSIRARAVHVWFWSILKCLFVEEEIFFYFKLLSEHLMEKKTVKKPSTVAWKSATNGYWRTKSLNGFTFCTNSNPFSLTYICISLFTWQNHEPSNRNKPRLRDERWKQFQFTIVSNGWFLFSYFREHTHQVMNIV